MQVRVNGTPIGGEDERELAWRERVAAEAKCLSITNVSGVSLAFTLEPGRRVDVDNLARPALAGLRDAGWFTRGYKTLDRIVVTKVHGDDVGVAILPTAAAPDLDREASLQIFSKNMIPSEGKHDVKRMWCDVVRQSWSKAPMEAPIELQLGFRTKLSLVDLLKPNIDALEPVLGRDPRGRLELCPLDDKITRLTAWRISGDFAMIVRIFGAQSPAAIPSH